MRKFLLLLSFLMTFGLVSAQTEVEFNLATLYGGSTISDISSKGQSANGVSISFAKSNASNAPAYNKAGEVRLYGGKSATVLDGNTMTITSTAGNITNISLTAGSSCTWGTLTADNGTIKVDNSHNATWTGESNSVTITVSRNSTNTSAATQYRMKTITVTVGSASPDAVTPPTITIGDNNMVSITAEDGAEIYYTTDGTTKPTTASAKYSAPFAITKATTVKAIAVLNGKQSSVTTKELKLSSVSNIAEFVELANTASATKINTPVTAIYKNGSYMWIKDAENNYLLSYGNIAGVTSVTNGDVYSFITGTYKYQYGVPEILPTAIGEKSTGTPVDPIEIESFEEIGTDMVNQYIKITDVKIEAATSPNYTATDYNGTTCTLRNVFTNSKHNDVLEVPEGEGFTVYGFVSLYVTSSATTIQINPIKIEGGTVIETVATPVFTPASGSALKVGDEISISCETEGAKIYIAFDEEVPTAATGMEYAAPLSFSENCKINAIAVKDGMLDSDVASATYSLYVEGKNTATFDFTAEGNIASLQSDATFVAPTSGKGVSINDINFQNGPIVLSVGKGTNTNNTAQWWYYAGDGRGLECRIYKGNEMNISLVENGYKITKITFEQNPESTTWGSMNITTNLGEVGATTSYAGGMWTNNTKTYEAPATGEVNLVTITPADNSRFAKMNVEYVVDENGVQGIEDIANDDANAPVEYYNLQGIRVNGENLTPGIYIRRQGSEVVKVLVK